MAQAEEKLRRELQSILDSRKIPYQSINVFHDDSLNVMFELGWDRSGNFFIKYNEFIRFMDFGGVRSIMEKEIDHYLECMQRDRYQPSWRKGT